MGFLGTLDTIHIEDGQAEQTWREAIDFQFQRYGIHPQCEGCEHECVQYAAENSVIKFCPRMRDREAPRP